MTKDTGDAFRYKIVSSGMSQTNFQIYERMTLDFEFRYTLLGLLETIAERPFDVDYELKHVRVNETLINDFIMLRRGY